MKISVGIKIYKAWRASVLQSKPACQGENQGSPVAGDEAEC